MPQHKVGSLAPEGDETLGTPIAPWRKSFVKDAHVYGDLRVGGKIQMKDLGIDALPPLTDGGVSLREVSDDPSLVSEVDGNPGTNAVPTQSAVVAYTNALATVPDPSSHPNGSFLVRDSASTKGYKWGSTIDTDVTIDAKTRLLDQVTIGQPGDSVHLRVYGNIEFPEGGATFGEQDTATTVSPGIVQLQTDLTGYATFAEDNRVPTAKTVYDAIQAYPLPGATLFQSGVVRLSDSFDGTVGSGDDQTAATTSAVKQATAVAENAQSTANAKEVPLTFVSPLSRTNDHVSVAHASTGSPGIVQLTSSVASTSETLAATAKSVREAYNLADTAKEIAENNQGPFDAISPLSFANNDTQLTVASSTLEHRGVVVSSSSLQDMEGDVEFRTVNGMVTGVSATPKLVHKAYTLASDAMHAARGHGLNLDAPLSFDENAERVSVRHASESESGVVAAITSNVESSDPTVAASASMVQQVRGALIAQTAQLGTKQDGLTFPSESPLSLDGTNLVVRDASVQETGVVRLSSSIENREDLAATPRAVMDVQAMANARVPMHGTNNFRGNLFTALQHRTMGSIDDHHFSLATNGTKRVTIRNTGQVGIGTHYIPGLDHALDVAGTVRASDFVQVSDRTAKTDVVTLSHAAEGIEALRGVRFRWKDDPERVHLGLIAQEVETAFPEAVFVDTETGQKSVAYASLVAPLIEANKSLCARVRSLEARLDAVGI